MSTVDPLAGNTASSSAMFTTVDATELTRLVAMAVPIGTPRKCKNRRFIAVVPSRAGLTSPVKLPAACRAITEPNGTFTGAAPM